MRDVSLPAAHQSSSKVRLCCRYKVTWTSSCLHSPSLSPPAANLLIRDAANGAPQLEIGGGTSGVRDDGTKKNIPAVYPNSSNQVQTLFIRIYASLEWIVLFVVTRQQHGEKRGTLYLNVLIFSILGFFFFIFMFKKTLPHKKNSFKKS